MGTSAGPNIITDGLVLDLDTADINSYPGEPTTNLVTYSEHQNDSDGNTGALSGWSDGTGTYYYDALNRYFNRGHSLKMTKTNALGGNYWTHQSYYFTTGDVVTVSAYIKASIAGWYDNPIYLNGTAENCGYSNNLTTEWVRHTFTYTIGATEWKNLNSYVYLDGKSIWLTGLQMELKSHATQYCISNGSNGTRSSTNGWKDLSGNNNHGNLISASYDSNAQINYNGTNNTVYTSLSSLSSSFTIDAWFKFDGLTGWQTIVGQDASESTSLGAIYFQKVTHTGATTSSGTRVGNTVGLSLPYTINSTVSESFCYDTDTAIANTWYNYLVSVDLSNIILYKNGKQINTKIITGSILTPASNVILGSGYYANSIGDRFSGSLSTIKIYNKALSPTEVLQNYNSQKTRFGL